MKIYQATQFSGGSATAFVELDVPPDLERRREIIRRARVQAPPVWPLDILQDPELARRAEICASCPGENLRTLGDGRPGCADVGGCFHCAKMYAYVKSGDCRYHQEEAPADA